MKSTFFRLPPSTHVFHMESDRLIPGQILYSDMHTSVLRTTNGSYTTDVFDFRAIDRINIWDFTQASEYEIVFAAQNIDCLRIYNRLQGTVYKLAGSCDDMGFRDGTDALFYGPHTVVQDNQIPCLFYVTDSLNKSLRMVTKSHIPHVTTLLTSNNKLYSHLTQEPEGRYLYITYIEGLERYDLAKNTSLDIVSKSTRYTNDALMYDGAIVHLEGIILYRHLVIIADRGRQILFVVDLTNNTTSTICTGVEGHRAGNDSFCQLSYPKTLLELNGDIYIGELGNISVLRGTTYTHQSEH